jgi:zinc protease
MIQPKASGMTATMMTQPEISSFKLANGMEVVVIPDHRAPVATHMVWYRNGSADDPPGKSGIAHFLEHLMFKGTEKHAKGEFSNMVSELGGQENAFTSYDYTAYYQRVPREHLGTMMAYEADRMSNLVLKDEDVIPERDVVLEERRMRTDSNPQAQLQESVDATLYVHHPYGNPIIGWNHEIEGLNRDDALAYYRHFYTPENAILVISGDVTPEAVKALADQSYGAIPARGAAPVRERRLEPPIPAARRVELADPKVEQPNLQRFWLVPNYRLAEGNTAFAIEVMAHMLGSGQTSRLYKALVQEQEIATSAGAWYWGDALDQSRFAVSSSPRDGVTLDQLAKAIEGVIASFANGVSERELARCKTRLIADVVYAQDSQTSLARMYGSALAIGNSIADVQSWPSKIDAVTASDVQAAAATWLSPRRAVTGYLIKEVAA